MGLGRAVNAADVYVNSMGLSILTESDPQCSDGTMIETLGLEPERVAVVLSDFNTEYKTMVQYFR